jgi:hypothetical protein
VFEAVTFVFEGNRLTATRDRDGGVDVWEQVD